MSPFIEEERHDEESLIAKIQSEIFPLLESDLKSKALETLVTFRKFCVEHELLNDTN